MQVDSKRAMIADMLQQRSLTVFRQASYGMHTHTQHQPDITYIILTNDQGPPSISLACHMSA